jgi:MyTH4 domain
MAFCTSTFPPEESMQKSLVGLLLDIFHYSAPKIHESQFAEWAQLCLDYLRKAILFGDRRLLPSFQELEAIKVPPLLLVLSTN